MGLVLLWLAEPAGSVRPELREMKPEKEKSSKGGPAEGDVCETFSFDAVGAEVLGVRSGARKGGDCVGASKVLRRSWTRSHVHTTRFWRR